VSTEYPSHDDESDGINPLTGVAQNPAAAKTSARQEIVRIIVSYTTHEATDAVYAAIEHAKAHPSISVAEAMRYGETQIKKRG
jgi:hypothetical protein